MTNPDENQRTLLQGSQSQCHHRCCSQRQQAHNPRRLQWMKYSHMWTSMTWKSSTEPSTKSAAQPYVGVFQCSVLMDVHRSPNSRMLGWALCPKLSIQHQSWSYWKTPPSVHHPPPLRSYPLRLRHQSSRNSHVARLLEQMLYLVKSTTTVTPWSINSPNCIRLSGKRNMYHKLPNMHPSSTSLRMEIGSSLVTIVASLS